MGACPGIYHSLRYCIHLTHADKLIELENYTSRLSWSEDAVIFRSVN